MKSHSFKILTTLAALIGIQMLMAYWSASNEGKQAFVTNGSVKIPMGNMKIASDTAKDLNHAEDKAEKRKEKDEKKSTDSDKK